MGIFITDRRQDGGRSTINRRRFFRRFQGQIRKAVSDAISGRSINDIEKGESVSIPAKDLSEPFYHSNNRTGRRVYAGNDQFRTRDEIDRPIGGTGGGSGSGASNSGASEDDFVFQLSREEFLNIFFDDLALPNLTKTQLLHINEWHRSRAGLSPVGSPANRDIKRTKVKGVGRGISMGMPPTKRSRLAGELDDALLKYAGDPDIDRIRAIERYFADPDIRLELWKFAQEKRDWNLERIVKELGRVPSIDPIDEVYRVPVRVPNPSTQAVMFCLMDVSGSMDEEKKQIAKRFFMLLYLFLTRTYKHIELVFIRHHTVAKEVQEEEFFHARESGGTVVSSALQLMCDIVRERYTKGVWNIYGAQASDGDNWENDSPACHDLLVESIMPLVQYFAYIEITAGDPQNLWREYERVAGRHKHFAMQRIKGLPDIFSVFRELFKKRA